MQVLRLAPKLIVAPKAGRNKFGCFAQDDTFVFVDGFMAVRATRLCRRARDVFGRS
jgi:hypothetical protein